MAAQLYIEESGLRFGPYDPTKCFQIEKDVDYLTHVKRVEFVLLHPSCDRISLVEARSSIPKEREKFYLEILLKFRDSIDLLLAEKLGRQPKMNALLPPLFKSLKWDTLIMDMILVIPSLPDDIAPVLTDQLQIILQPITQLFQNHQGKVVVFNEKYAEENKLIIKD